MDKGVRGGVAGASRPALLSKRVLVSSAWGRGGGRQGGASVWLVEP